MSSARLSAPSFLAGLIACALLPGCAGGLAQSPSTSLKSSQSVAASPVVPDNTNNVKTIKPSGGTIRAITYGGFGGTLAYASNNAGPKVTLTLTNSGPSNAFGAPTPNGATPVLFLAAQVSGTQPVAFNAAGLEATVSSKSLVTNVSYTVYLYEGSSLVGSTPAFLGDPKRHMLAFATPLQGIGITPGSPLVMELVPTNDEPGGTVFLSNFNNNTVTMYVPPFTGSGQGLSATIGAGINGPNYIALDSGGNLYVANYFSNNVAVYAPPFSGSSMPVLTIGNGLSGPNGVAFDAKGNLFVSNLNNNTVTIYSPPFIGASQGLQATIVSQIAEPYGVTVGPGGYLYVANVISNTVVGYRPPFSNSSAPVLTLTNGLHGPTGVALDASGTLYVTNIFNNSVGIYSPPLTGSSAPSATITNGIQWPYQDVVDAQGNLYVANGWLDDSQQYDSATIYSPPFNGSSQGLTTTLTNALNFPNGIAVQAGVQSPAVPARRGRAAGSVLRN